MGERGVSFNARAEKAKIILNNKRHRVSCTNPSPDSYSFVNAAYKFSYLREGIQFRNFCQLDAYITYANKYLTR